MIVFVIDFCILNVAYRKNCSREEWRERDKWEMNKTLKNVGQNGSIQHLVDCRLFLPNLHINVITTMHDLCDYFRLMTIFLIFSVRPKTNSSLKSGICIDCFVRFEQDWMVDVIDVSSHTWSTSAYYDEIISTNHRSILRSTAKEKTTIYISSASTILTKSDLFVCSFDCSVGRLDWSSTKMLLGSNTFQTVTASINLYISTTSTYLKSSKKKNDMRNTIRIN